MNCSLASLYTGLIANSTIFSATVVDSRRLLEDASIAFAWNSERETAPAQQYYLLQHHQCMCPMPGPDVRALCFDVILPTENAEPGWLIYVSIIPASILIWGYFVMCNFSLGTAVTCEDAEFALILSLCFKIIIIGSVEIYIV